MSRKRPNNPEFPVFGISPLGGNSVEATDTQYAEIRSEEAEAVPLVWDDRVGGYISDLAKMELDDQDISLEKSRAYNEEAEFRAKAGYEQT